MNDLYDYSNINEDSKKFAVDHLKENPAQVNAHIESFRRWVNAMPHLNCPTDSHFLLRFLRVAKFDHKKAEKRLDNFCTMRSSARGFPRIFDKTNFDEEKIYDLIDSQIFIPLGQCNNGEIILFIKSKNWDPDKYPFIELAKHFFLTLDILLEKEEVQIHGVRLLGNLEGVTKKTYEAAADPLILKNSFKIMQDAYPFRMKGFIFYNTTSLFDILLSMCMFFMNDKLKRQITNVQNDLANADFPGLINILPNEYGGQGESMMSISDKWKEKVKAYFRKEDPMKCISVDESKRPNETVAFLTDYKDYKGITYGTEGTFTKYDNVF